MPTILTDVQNRIATVTINRPEALNALNTEMIAELSAVFTGLAASSVRAIILTGAGDKAFVAGADIKEFAQMDPPAALTYAALGQNLTRQIEHMDVPVIAAINGFALGGGCELALACHFRIASQNAIMGQPEVGLGVIPGFGGSQRLPRIIGKGLALEMLTTGRRVDAARALSIGLVNKVTSQDDLLNAAGELAQQIARQGPAAVAATLRAVREGLELSLEKGLKLEAELFSALFGTEEMLEGTQAFLEKRPTEFGDAER
ncbi:MAG: enoyl-CoA hydratase/isomerase family protein [Candidatus Marinimicrobia bacterium]|nr:enoyl-CoA hydratase/isomerase family protein [Candidatus Neomarinimicrobiota bacterium]